MKNKINKTLNLILLLSMLNGNILSMQESDVLIGIVKIVQQERSLLDLPAETINYIIYQIIKPYENRIRNIDNIFEFYLQLDSKPLVSDLIGISLASKDLRLWTLDLIDRLKRLKEKKYQGLVNSIKNQYQGLSLDELNRLLSNVLNQLPIDKSNLEEIAKLILLGANVNEGNNYGATALMFAALYGHKGIVQLIISNGANVNKKNYFGDTALMCAARHGCKDIVQLLIDTGANVNERDNDGDTALMCAVKCGHKDIVQLLIDNKAYVDQINNHGDTALTLAARANHEDIVELLEIIKNKKKQK